MLWSILAAYHQLMPHEDQESRAAGCPLQCLAVWQSGSLAMANVSCHYQRKLIFMPSQDPCLPLSQQTHKVLMRETTLDAQPTYSTEMQLLDSCMIAGTMLRILVRLPELRSRYSGAMSAGPSISGLDLEAIPRTTVVEL
jgi:hypothetical protein